MKKSDLKSFVRERLVELLHKETIDSYRVRNHYSLSLMEEFDILLTEWNSNQIKNIATIEASAQELICALKCDLCIDFSFYSIPLFEKDIADYLQEVSSKEKKRIRLFSHHVFFIFQQGFIISFLNVLRLTKTSI